MVGVKLGKRDDLVSHHVPKFLILRHSRLTVQKLLTRTLKTLRTTTSNMPLSLALNPTTTMIHATRPSRLTAALQKDQEPEKTNPTNKKISRTLPPSWKYIFRSFSSRVGSPAGAKRFRTQLSDRTIIRPPKTERLRRKKFRSKIRPYPKAWVMTTPHSPMTAYSECRRLITSVEQVIMATMLTMRKTCVIPRGTRTGKNRVSR
jgi:hypothetical protein